MALALRIHDISQFYDFIDGKNIDQIEILITHKDIFTDDFFVALGLDDKRNEHKLKEVLEKVYTAVFYKSFILDGEKECVGLIEIDGQTKQKFIEKICSLYAF